MNQLKRAALSLFRIFTMAAVILVFSLPAFAYEEDTHFQMTYVICRSVGFTHEEALIVAAVDQGMDDSPGVVAATTGPGGLPIPQPEAEWMWHALDGYGWTQGGTMKVTGILTRRDQLFQDALKETTVANKLIRLGVFFHYQQDTWAHRHHYTNDPLRGPIYEPNHLSRNNYVTYNTPHGHAADGHFPDRTPYDPVAALMNLEDGVIYASRFLKDGLGRNPRAFLGNYAPQGNNGDDRTWNDPRRGTYFHQINMFFEIGKFTAQRYLFSLIRAQIDAYKTTKPNSGLPAEADLNATKTNLEKVCKDFEPYRADGKIDPIIIPTTAEKTALGFNGITKAELTGKLPDAHFLLGIGRDGFLFTKRTLISDWVKIENSGLMLSVDMMPDGTILGVAQDNMLWTRKTLTSPWSRIDGSGAVISAITMPDGTILAVGKDNNMWTRKTLTDPWVQVSNSGYVKSVAVLPDGTLLGVGLDNFLFTRPAVLGNQWNKIDGSGFVIAITVMENGTILGIGTDNNLFTRATPTSQWVPIPNSGYVVSVSEIPVK